MRKVLIANRGEIACRIARTCRELGIQTLAVYSFADRNARHIYAADTAASLPAQDNTRAYLSISDILNIARAHGCDALHPGYGFLAENAELADACAATGITFIGPPAAAMRLLGDKQSARKRAQEKGVPIAPGLNLPADPAQATQTVEDFLQSHGLPALIKAAAGGGGKGMRRIESNQGIAETVSRAADEALKLFGNGALYLEKCIERARHIEVQFIADSHGTVGILFDRDCSTQRNNQKIIEEGPAIALSDTIRQQAYAATRALVEGSGYSGAGTAEFLLSDTGHLYFLEVNARLQVEHPVTEVLTDLDLVALQIEVARGGAIAQHLPQNVLPATHCIELRICAESSDGRFQPSSGRLLRCRFPQKPGVRIDTGYGEGDFFSPHFDSLLAKIIVTAQSRGAALQRARDTLAAVEIAGVESNCAFLQSILTRLRDDEVIYTSFVAEFLAAYSHERLLAAAACRLLVFLIAESEIDANTAHWALSGSRSVSRVFRYKDSTVEAVAHRADSGSTHITSADVELTVSHYEYIPAHRRVLISGPAGTEEISVIEQNRRYWVQSAAGAFVLEPAYKTSRAPAHAGVAECVQAELPGAVLRVCAAAGDIVQAGTVLAVLESMKMEHEIRSPADRKVFTVGCTPGQQVAAGDVLFELETIDSTD